MRKCRRHVGQDKDPLLLTDLSDFLKKERYEGLETEKGEHSRRDERESIELLARQQQRLV